MSAAFDTVIIGAGNAGVSLAARLRRDGQHNIALVDPSPVHRYRPMLNYAATGLARMGRYERAMSSVVPAGVQLLPHLAGRVDTDAHTVTLGPRDEGPTVTYDNLVVCPGLTPRWDAIPGLDRAYIDGWAVSAHVPEYAGRACAALVRVREGTVVFSVPPEPASCGGTVLKAMFLACDRWRREEVLDRIDVHLVTPFRGLLGLDPCDSRLQPLIQQYGITVHDESEVAAVDHHARTVTLDGPVPATIEHVNLAYVTPLSRAPKFVAEAGLSDGGDAGLVEVDPQLLRHARVDSVWGLGDAATVGTRPSGGALRSQVAVVADNLRAARDGGTVARYDGYTIIPIAVSRDRLMLAEHDRDGVPAPSVRGIDLTVPRRSTYAFDRYLQPVVYFRKLLRGRV
ncbi:FAD-dependent oxidoreductase [Dietzia psychralcaliphila]|uniref:Pyridine nucleotide-disulfide oxidoreductase n=1 Tax=Dietzia psychralcaliphila TaxID=139021 RepID=A0AAD0JUY5_9ACTN|nr:FAD/NAD(P)-binding oxidoreductase [Dietzia psychralcaliphila]AWH96315.1 pyridine nucleotide-disulfide oxidoreductase [Dietzia psychralcaliphila]PTM90587.1 sulfide:quinone oxidoreductase [Dietzia psychralcaliphila]